MNLAVAVTIQSAEAGELAQCPIAGRPWLARLVARVRRARCVTEVVVVCRQGEGEIGPLARSLDAPLIVSDDRVAAAGDLDGAHDAVAFCDVTQLFADPVRLDELASLEMTGGAARALAVLASEPSIALTGGPFLEAITRDGLRDAADRTSVSDLRTATLLSLPGPPEMRLESTGDMDWAVRAEEALLARHASRDLAHFEDVLREAGMRRFRFWDEIGPAPSSVLTVRCERLPLFQQLMRYLGRLPNATVDVIVRADLAAETAATPGVGRVFTFEGTAFSVGGLGQETLASIAAARYDLCVIPRREPTGFGFENLVPLANASRARTAVWLDIFGRTGLLAGRPHGWDPACAGGPHERAEHYLRRAVRALDVFDPSSPSAIEMPAAIGG